MNPLLIAAFALIISPDGSAVPAHDPLLCESVRAVAIKLELLDPREVRYITNNPSDFESDVNLLRRRYGTMGDAPYLCESTRLPDRQFVSEYTIPAIRKYKNYIETEQFFDYPWRSQYYQTILDETETLYQIWDTVRDAKCEYYYVTVRRQALKRLRDLLGPKDYYAGQMPPTLPTWRFVTIK
jgi:hypothetical protein